MKNIALFTRTLSKGGAEKVLSNISLHLPNEYNTTIILYDSDRIDYSYRGKIVSLDSRPSKGLLSKILAFMCRTKEVKKIKNSRNIAVTISFLDSPNIVNIFARCNDKIIVSVRNYKSRVNTGLLDTISTFLTKTFYNKADKVVAVSELIKFNLIENFNIQEEKIEVIYNPYDIDNIVKLSREPIGDQHKAIFEEPTLINVGRFNKQKGQKYLIQVFAELKKEIRDLQLVFLGEGELEDKLKYQARELGVEGDVHFLGFQNNPYKFIANSSLFVFPSLHEGFPNALVEAMACGTPVISSDCKSGPREILAPGTDIRKQTKVVERAKYGVLMPTFTEESNNYTSAHLWKNEIKSILLDSELHLKYSTLGRERVEDFSAAKVIEKWIALI